MLLQELYNSTLLSKLNGNSDIKRSRLRTERKQYKGGTSEFVHFLKVINASISLELITKILNSITELLNVENEIRLYNKTFSF